MKTYKHLFEDMTRREKIRECVLIAAKGKTGRPEVARILKPERDPGDDAPPPRCFEEHIDVIQNILLTESIAGKNAR